MVRLHRFNQSKLCLICNKEYFRKRDVNHKRWANSKYCSNQCHQKNRGYSFEDYFKKYVEVTEGCWLFHGCKDKGGYGLVNLSKLKRKTRAHRAAWAYFNGPIPEGLFVLHKCDVRNCVNPLHLFLGTQLDNMRDCKQKNRLKPPTPKHGEANHMAKLKQEQVNEVFILKKQGISQAEIARQFKVSPMTISRIVNNQTWSNENG